MYQSILLINEKTILSKAIILFIGLVCFIFYSGWYPYHFYYQEQNQLFLNDWQYVAGYFSQPAWLSCLLGDWLTQFYYYRFAGPAILAVSLVLLGLLTRRALHKIGLRRFSTVIAVVAMLFFADFSFYHEYRLASLLSTLGGIILFILCHRRWYVTLLGFVLTWWLFGNGILAYTVLLIGGLFIHAPSKRQFRITVVGLLILFCLIPLTRHLYVLDIYDLYTYPGLGKICKPELSFEKEFGAEAEYGLGNWNHAVAMTEKEKEPSQGQLFFYNLVMAQRGELPDVLLKWPDNYLGTFEKIGPDTPVLTIKRMNELYWALGDMTFAERAAMQALVFSPMNRNVKMVKRLAEINLTTGNKAAAEKYLRLLDKTAVYGRWAAEMRQNSDFYKRKALMTNHKDTLRLSDNAHLIMMELLDSNPGNTVALDYLLCSDLLLKDITNFKRDYDRYCMPSARGNHKMRMKTLYQQALMIWLAGTDAPQEEWQRYIKMPSELQRFQAYSHMRGNPAFKDTYWYWFDTHK